MQICSLTMIIPQDSGILAVRIVFELAAVDLVLGLNGKMVGFGFAAYDFVVRCFQLCCFCRVSVALAQWSKFGHTSSTVFFLPCDCGASSVVKTHCYAEYVCL
jgi:hypothetical protein